MRALTVALLCFCAAAMAAPLVIDGDADGVDDAVDQCLYSPPGAAVDARGCSSQADDDGDGVPDEVDACPYSPPGVRVDLRGCALDEDGDGVADGLDRCPLTAAGAEVDALGCAGGQQAVALVMEPSAPQPVKQQPQTQMSASMPVRQADQPSLPRVVFRPDPLPESALPAAVPAFPERPPAAASPVVAEAAKALPPPAAAPVPKVVAIPEMVPAAKPVASNASTQLQSPANPPSVPKAANAVASPAAATTVAIDNILLRLNYEPQSAQIGTAGLQSLRARLPRLRQELAADARTVLLIRGYADAASDGAEPDTLARTRANRLRKLLEAEGIDGERLRTLGMAAAKGESRPEQRKADLVLASE